jgi:uncharacterized ion transporter superfamily protein YfcC
MSTRFRFPDTLVLLFGLMVLAWASTWVLPQGRFETVEDARGHELVVPGTYAPVAERVELSPVVLFTVVPRALAAAQDIIFFVLIAGGAIGVLRGTGMIDALLGATLRRIGHSPGLLIGLGTAVFAAGSGAIGAAEEYIPFAALLVALCRAMGLDAVTAVAIVVVGYSIGYAVAPLNPFTVQVAQGVAGLPPTSGMGFRLALFLPFVAIGVHHVYRYSQRVAADPSRSLVADLAPVHLPPSDYPPLDGRRLAVLVVALAAIVAMVAGIVLRGWYLVELGALFVALALVAGIVGGLGADGTARRFAEGAAELAGTALLIGFARAVALLLEDGQVLHTVVNGLAGPLSTLGAHAAAIGMLLIQGVMNLLVPSGSGQAFVTMPIMAPLGDLVGVSRQVAVLAYQFGDGFLNMIIPTNVILMSIIGIAGVPYDRWVRFIAPLVLKLVVAGAVTLAVAVEIGYR